MLERTLVAPEPLSCVCIYDRGTSGGSSQGAAANSEMEKDLGGKAVQGSRGLGRPKFLAVRSLKWSWTGTDFHSEEGGRKRSWGLWTQGFFTENTQGQFGNKIVLVDLLPPPYCVLHREGLRLPVTRGTGHRSTLLSPWAQHGALQILDS